MVAFISCHAERRTADGLRWGVEPICRVLTEHGVPIAPSTYYDARARARVVTDADLRFTPTCGRDVASRSNAVQPTVNRRELASRNLLEVVTPLRQGRLMQLLTWLRPGDPIRRYRVQRKVRAIVALDPWRDNDPTPEGLARLALLRSLALQQATRRAVRWRHREAAAMLARSSVEVCLVGAYIARMPGSADAMDGDLGRSLRRLVGYFVEDTLGGRQVLDAALSEFPTSRLPDMARVADELERTGTVIVAREMYDRYYNPLSNLYMHVSATSLLRQVDRRGETTRVRPWQPWSRRSPAHLADACVSLLALAVASNGKEGADPLLVEYANDHYRRALPVMTTMLAKLMSNRIRPRAIVLVWRAMREFLRYLDSVARTEATADQQRVRATALLDEVNAIIGLHPPAVAREAILDSIVAAMDARRRGLTAPDQP